MNRGAGVLIHQRSTLEQSGVKVVDSQMSSFERWIFGTYFVVQPKLRGTVSVLAKRKMASLWR